ncbi:MAG: hypothetical protein OHK93_005829 [Ramalina farinacea]|uniref:TauD/TfdA-like domain-containing protein n=1 Tax=Ramalina farinacea TaxID=258253 RepID=A0AA43QHF9_9LECA|nr:hypothetical protein [Ramalina farinacea]
MAPALTSIESETSSPLPDPKAHVSKAIFPDGIKTSGQHEPIYEDLRDYADFPEIIDGPTVWKAEDYKDNPERWVHHFSEQEISELSTAADDFRASNTPLTGITKDNFTLPHLSTFLASIRNELLNGKGFILFKGFPVERWGNHKSAIAYMGLGTYLGYFVSQNGKGHVLGHVKDLGDDATQIDRVRIYRTNARQFFHGDSSDIVGLLCIARALSGGESDIASVHHIYNTLRRTHPSVLRLLSQPIWYFDRKGEVSLHQAPYIRAPVLYLEPRGQGRVYCRYDPYFIRSLSRFSSGPNAEIPPLSPEQEEAARVLEETAEGVKLHMVLEVGDIQFLSNSHVLHARTAYTDHPPPVPRRHLMRLWLGTPEGKG